MNQFIKDKVKEFEESARSQHYCADHHLCKEAESTLCYWGKNFLRLSLLSQIEQVKVTIESLYWKEGKTFDSCDAYNQALTDLLALPILNPTPNDL